MALRARAGKHRHKITIEQRTVVRSATGATRDAWNEIGDAWVSIEPLNGREFYASNQTVGESTHKLRAARWDDIKGATEEMRAVFGTRIFDIIDVINVREGDANGLILAKEQA